MATLTQSVLTLHHRHRERERRRQARRNAKQMISTVFAVSLVAWILLSYCEIVINNGSGFNSTAPSYSKYNYLVSLNNMFTDICNSNN